MQSILNNEQLESETLNISESFFSLQGEGKTMGVPAIFLRLTSCNLLCGGNLKTGEYDKTYKKPYGNARWVCDTINVWKTGKTKTFKEIVDEFEQNGWFEKLRNGTHIILTGGEPLIMQEKLIKFFRYFVSRYEGYPFIEVETNTTIPPSDDFDLYIAQYNCSPKLSNSGMPLENRYKEEVIKQYVNRGHAIFKFVVLDEQDVNEVLRDFTNKFDIHPSRIWLMPGAISRQQLIDNEQKIIEICKKHSFNFSSRLQLIIWDKTTGV